MQRRAWNLLRGTKPPLNDAVLLQQRLLVTGYPAEDLRLPVQLLNEVVNIEVYRYVRPILTGTGCRPGDMGHAMMFVYRGEADMAYPHFLRSHRPIVRIALRQELLELIAILSGHDPGRRGAYELGSVQRCGPIDVHIAAKGLIEEGLVSLEQLPYGALHLSFPLIEAWRLEAVWRLRMQRTTEPR